MQPKSTSRRSGLSIEPISSTSAVVVPVWLRASLADRQSVAGQSVEDVALATGAAIYALDVLVRGQERWGGAWRQRLAIGAAAVTARQAGRVEDEAALRDAVLLTKHGDNVGPAGRMLLVWRQLAMRPAEKLLTQASIVSVFDGLGLPPDDEMAADLADELKRLLRADTMVGATMGVFIAVEALGLPGTVGSWFANVMLARRLGWIYAVPIFGGEAAGAVGSNRSKRASSIAPSGVDADSARTKTLLAAQARGALYAIDLAADLGRRSERLLAVAPKLRAKAADTVVEKLLSDDAVVASEKIVGMSDRGLRRLFDRLIELDAVRELSGRPTFRIYGL